MKTSLFHQPQRGLDGKRCIVMAGGTAPATLVDEVSLLSHRTLEVRPLPKKRSSNTRTLGHETRTSGIIRNHDFVPTCRGGASVVQPRAPAEADISYAVRGLTAQFRGAREFLAAFESAGPIDRG